MLPLESLAVRDVDGVVVISGGGGGGVGDGGGGVLSRRGSLRDEGEEYVAQLLSHVCCGGAGSRVAPLGGRLRRGTCLFTLRFEP